MNKEPLVFTTINPPEISRTYLYPNPFEPEYPFEVTFFDVTELSVRKSGNHRLNMADGTKAIAMSGFLAIRIDSPEWSL